MKEFNKDEMKKERLELGLSQEKIARHLDVSTLTYRNWEKGVHVPRQSTWIKLVNYFNNVRNELFG